MTSSSTTAKASAIDVTLEALPEMHGSEGYILLDLVEAKGTLKALPDELPACTNGDMLASGHEVLASVVMELPPVLLFSLTVFSLLQYVRGNREDRHDFCCLDAEISVAGAGVVEFMRRVSNRQVLHTDSEERKENPPAADSILKGRTLRLVQATGVSCTYTTNTNYGLLSSHAKAPILDLHWSLSSPPLYSVSADHCFSITDLTTGQKVRRIRAHREIINSLDRTMASGSGTELITTASDDATVKIWEGGEEANKQPVTTLDICVGAVDNEVHVYDLRKEEQVYSLGGHTDTPTSLALSPDGNHLLAPSLSSRTIIHDVRLFLPIATRVHRMMHGSPAGFENTLLREIETSKILYKLPVHKGTVTLVDFHPKDPIILAGSKDGTMLLGGIWPTAIV
ncbi:WD40-repeat-containing domain protein [Coprinopsis sp. MPI-PUGE-AT-0042]|nr:WD40-repeat-containing domain protein [Coprinopsis sp. MPI-PUGE-AT-0042]